MSKKAKDHAPIRKIGKGMFSSVVEDYQPGDPIGWGQTKQEADHDLKRKIDHLLLRKNEAK